VGNLRREGKSPDILYTYGERTAVASHARSIVRARPLRLTTDLTRAIERVMGGPVAGTIRDRTFSGAADLRERRTQQPGEASSIPR